MLLFEPNFGRGDGGWQVFNVCVLFNHEEKLEIFVKLIHYLSFPGIESLSGSLLLNFGRKKKWQDVKTAFLTSRKTVWGESFGKKKLQFFIILNIKQKKFSMLAINCWQGHKKCSFVQLNIPREKNFSIFIGSLWIFFPFTFEFLLKKFKTLDEKPSTNLSKLLSTCPKEQFPENSFLRKLLRVQIFVCLAKLFPSFGRSLQ